MYAASTDPAIVANPPVIIACSSDGVITDIYGLTINGASVCPRNIFAAALSDSHAVVPTVIYKTQENNGLAEMFIVIYKLLM